MAQSVQGQLGTPYTIQQAKDFNMYQEEVMIPVGSWAEHRLPNLSDTDQIRDESKVGSGFGKNASNWLGRDKVYPNNVLHMATESSTKNHSAVFPVALPTWFIKLFTQPGDLVLDPFLGSGSTAVAALTLSRHFLGIEINGEYAELARERVLKAGDAMPSVNGTEMADEAMQGVAG